MNNKLRGITILIALLGSTGVLAQNGPGEAAGPTKPVHVTNTVDNPVPVSGTFDLNGTASVNVTNSESEPVPVLETENPDRSPYAEFGSGTITTGFVNTFVNFPTPKGRRYIIEQASVSCTTPSDTDVFTQALLSATKINSPSSTSSFGSPVVVLEKRGPSFFGGYLWTGTANIKVISDANPFSPDGSGALYFNIFHTDATVAASCFATLFGHTAAL